MQLDYYRSPCPCAPEGQVQTPESPCIPPTGAGRPRRLRRGAAVLILFLVLILSSIAALVILRIQSPEGWSFSLGDYLQRFDDGGFDFGNSDEFYEYFDEQWNESDTLTTIPRADLNPDVQLLLADLPEQSLSFQEIYEKVIPAIVSVQAYSNTSAYSGTGVVMTADGYIITNHHVISGCSSAQIVLSDGRTYDAALVGSDMPSDLAVLKIEAQDLTPAEFGNSDLLRVGDTTLAIGNPLGSELFGTMTEGIVSAINRDVNVSGYTMTLIQTTAALNPGNSGGALINSGGQVIGITNLKMMSNYETIEGLGFAIPTVWTKEVVDVLLAEGAITGRPTIGITCLTIPYGQAERYGRDSGVYVDSVSAGGPADRAGVQPGDVIVAANGQTITNMEDLTAVRDEIDVGGELLLTIWRDGETLELTLTLVDQYELN